MPTRSSLFYLPLVFVPRIYEPHEAEQNPKQNHDQTPKKQDRAAQLAGALSPSSTGLVSPLPQFDAAARHNISDSSPPTGGALYCSVCKKKFNNESTLLVHQQSDKHRRNARLSKQSGHAAGSPRGPPKKTQSNAKHHPVVQGAVASMRKAQAIMKQDPAVAATVLWNIAKDIAQYGEDGVTKLALEKALSCMQSMDANKELRGARESPASWSARSLLKTMLECRLALARLESQPAKAESAPRYTDALCAYLGVELGAIDGIARDRDPVKMDAAAMAIAKSIPRKFSKPEDVCQAIEAMEEVAGALFVFSGADSRSPLAWRSMAIYFLVHAFAIEKEKPDAAYRNVNRAISGFSTLHLEHLGCECAVLLMEHHSTQQGAHASVAKAAIDSLLSEDLVRARSILQKYNAQFEQPWSKYLSKLVAKMIGADATWFSIHARSEWDVVVAGADSPANRRAHDLVRACLDAVLREYTLYAPVGATA
ncbi:hypothetical protein GQ54DRAFT_307858 [Martensiomyces pterosporus]|nr:hypothetical protein GQ54DRAFT_307858 [Martensiomyces pterosporus]